MSLLKKLFGIKKSDIDQDAWNELQELEQYVRGIVGELSEIANLLHAIIERKKNNKPVTESLRSNLISRLESLGGKLRKAFEIEKDITRKEKKVMDELKLDKEPEEIIEYTQSVDELFKTTRHGHRVLIGSSESCECHIPLLNLFDAQIIKDRGIFYLLSDLHSKVYLADEKGEIQKEIGHNPHKVTIPFYVLMVNGNVGILIHFI